MVAPSVRVLLFYETMMARTAEQQHVVKITNHPRATVTMRSGHRESAALATTRVQFLSVRWVCMTPSSQSVVVLRKVRRPSNRLFSLRILLPQSFIARSLQFLTCWRIARLLCTTLSLPGVC